MMPASGCLYSARGLGWSHASYGTAMRVRVVCLQVRGWLQRADSSAKLWSIAPCLVARRRLNGLTCRGRAYGYDAACVAPTVLSNVGKVPRRAPVIASAETARASQPVHMSCAVLHHSTCREPAAACRFTRSWARTCFSKPMVCAPRAYTVVHAVAHGQAVQQEAMAEQSSEG